jgi:hypothetical protein
MKFQDNVPRGVILLDCRYEQRNFQSENLEETFDFTSPPMQRFESRRLLQSSPLRKHKWTADEDERLRSAVAAFGMDSWNRISALVPKRTGKQCRERWMGQLAPSVSKNTWLPEEDAILVDQQKIAGNRWAIIASQLPGRSALSIKNRWNWLTRHRNPMDGRTPNQRSDIASPPDVVERQKTCQVVFEPLMSNDSRFGAGFHEFQARMFMGTQ